MNFIAWFSELSKGDVPIAGGKGANLGEMYNAKLPVPPGFVVTAGAFKAFLENTRLNEKIFPLLKGLNVEDNEALQKAATDIQELIIKTPMPPEISNAIKEAYENLDIDESIVKEASKEALSIVKGGREPPLVAVRSSATAEDLPSLPGEEHVFARVNGHTTYCKFSELYDQIGNGTTTNLEVPSIMGNKLTWTRAQQIYRHPARENKLYKITTNYGKEITITPNHSILVLDKDTLEPKSIKIGELKADDLIPTVSKLPETNINPGSIDLLDYIRGRDVVEENGAIKIKNNSTNWKMQNELKRKIGITDDFLYFLGVYSAEGCTYKDNCVIITNSDREVLRRVKRFLKSINLYSGQKLNSGSVRVYCKPLVRFMHEATGKPLDIKGKGRSCKIKRVPNFIFELKKHQIGEYLKGCFDGDGHVSKDGTVEFTSTSEMLSGGVTKLLELLGFKLSLGRSGNALTVRLAVSEIKKFNELIGSSHKMKSKRLSQLIESYDTKKSHPEFKQTLEINDQLSGLIRKKFESLLQKQRVEVPYCPQCNEKVGRSSSYNGRERYYCPCCKRAMYSKDTCKVMEDRYIYYDEKGKFKKGMCPHNKAVLKGDYNINKLKKILTKHGIKNILEYFNEDIRWERIRNVESLDYQGWVYDFTVPGPENFVGGIGGIITHNTASFAGQQATFLNIKGSHPVITSVQKCWASLYTARAIYYREKNNFPHEKVLIATIVQKMVASEKAGVMFSINPATNNENEVMIEAAFGLGESVVSGSITPDQYIIDKETEEIKNITIGNKESMIILDTSFGKNVKRTLPPDKRKEQVLTESEIETLTDLAKRVEHHYGSPQDMEFAIQGPRTYIVQSRPVTTMKKTEEHTAKEESEIEEEAGKEPILTGIPASPGVGTGPVKIVNELDDLNKIKEGDVLVAEMTNPDYVPAMEKSVAIVTDRGGSTAHAAIVGREMGIPVIVGTKSATQVLQEGEIVTVDATAGKVYEGELEVKHEEKEEEQLAPMELETATEVKVIVDLPQFAEKAASTGADGVGLLRCEMMLATSKAHPSYLVKHGRKDELIETLVNGISAIAKSFENKPVWYRTSDFRTDEYRDLEGGDEEPEEDNPMMGYHGVRRGMAEKDLMRAEFEAIKKVHERGYTNVGIMLPLVTQLDEVKTSKELLREAGLEPQENIDFGVMVETPAAVQIIREICEEGIDFVSFGTNDLTQFTLALDRNNENVADLYDEMHPAVLRQIKHVIETCREYNVETSICGQAGSKPEMAEFLVKTGIDSISANADSVHKIRNIVAKAEKKILLDVARRDMQDQNH